MFTVQGERVWESCSCEGVCRQSVLSKGVALAPPQASEIELSFSSTGGPSSQSKEGSRAGMCYHPQQEAVTEVPNLMLRRAQTVQAPVQPALSSRTGLRSQGHQIQVYASSPPSQPPRAQKLPDPGTLSQGRWGVTNPESTEVLPDLSLSAAAPPHTMHAGFVFFSSLHLILCLVENRLLP